MSGSALIIAGPGPLRESLQALVDTMPQIGAVEVLSDVRSARKDDGAPCPALVLLDASPTGDGVWKGLRWVKIRWPKARTIVLVRSVQEQAEAKAGGADEVLMHGFPAGRLVAAIVKLLPQPVV